MKVSYVDIYDGNTEKIAKLEVREEVIDDYECTMTERFLEREKTVVIYFKNNKKVDISDWIIRRFKVLEASKKELKLLSKFSFLN